MAPFTELHRLGHLSLAVRIVLRQSAGSLHVDRCQVEGSLVHRLPLLVRSGVAEGRLRQSVVAGYCSSDGRLILKGLLSSNCVALWPKPAWPFGPALRAETRLPPGLSACFYALGLCLAGPLRVQYVPWLRLAISDVQDAAGSVALNKHTPASSSWFLYRVKSEGFLVLQRRV